MKLAAWILLLAAVAAAAVWAVAERFYRIAFVRAKEEPVDINALGKPWTAYLDEVRDGIEWFLSHVTEEVSVSSFDGLRLTARVIEQENARGTALLCHGYRSQGFLDFSCAFSFYYEQGLNLVVIDERACGLSEGDTITFGLNESRDVRTWLDWVNGRYGDDRPVILGGVSMGCTTVLLSLEHDLPSNVVGIIGDCGFTSPWDQLTYILRRDYHLPPFPLMHLVNVLFRRRTGCDLRAKSTVTALGNNTRIPVLFIHGGADRFVPTDFSRENYRACAADKDLLIVESAAHATSFLADPIAYRKRAKAFLDRVLDGKDGR